MRSSPPPQQPTAPRSFAYLKPGQCYFDSACQTLRPQEVIDAEVEYYTTYNACGGRVKYRWGERVDAVVNQTRQRLLRALGKSERDYAVAFTLNTTYGLNLILHQLRVDHFSRLVTSDTEHNSVFLPTMAMAKKYGVLRTVITRRDDGTLPYEEDDLAQSVAIINTVSNIDGRVCGNAAEFARDLHRHGGILLVDAAQAMVHHRALLSRLDFDCLFGSAHKMYGPSLGFIIIKKELLRTLDVTFIGGGMVNDVSRESYELIADDQELSAELEPGLQNWSGIIGLNAALQWLEHYQPNGISIERHASKLSQALYDGLKAIPSLSLVNAAPSPIISFSSSKIDAHQLSLILSEQGVMARSGYFCCHYYLQHVRRLPPLLRFSIGLHNTPADVARAIAIVSSTLNAL